jgi:hypothetical protein
MNKIIIAHADWFHGEPIMLPLFYGTDAWHRKSLVKHAACSEAEDYIKNACKAEPGRTKFLVHAVASGEAYGPNRNGDYFKEADLKATHGTFVKFAKVYKHHKNKDPQKSYGDVEKSFYNPKMKRIELITSTDNAKSPEIISQWEKGESPAVSMACKVPFDKCSMCGHESAKISEYCDHLKNHMNEIFEDGKQACAHNPDPTFFDISYVWRPAERVAYVLKKVASSCLYLPSALLAEDEPERFPLTKAATDKEALIQKLSEIEKKIEGQIAGKIDPDSKEVAQTPDLPDKVIDRLGKENPGTATKALSDKGIMLKLPEFIKMLIGDSGMGDELGEHLPGSISRGDVPKESTRFEEDGDSPCGLKSMLDSFMGDRSLFKMPAVRRSIKIIIIGGGKPEMRHAEEKHDKHASETALQKQILEAYNGYRMAACEHVLRTKCAADAESFLRLSILQGYLK